MSSVHSSASFKNACIVMPRDPRTNLPRSRLERRSANCRDKSSTNVEKNGRISRGNVAEKVINNFQASSSVNQIKNKSSVSFAEEMLVNSDTKDELLSTSLDASQLKELIDDDDKFFEHLQVLKRENQRTLKTLKRLYEHGKQHPDRLIFHGAVSEEESPHVANDNSYVTRNYLDALNRVTLDDGNEKLTVLSSCSSEDELDRELKVQVPSDHVNILPDRDDDNQHTFRGRASSYDVISNMWENFSVDEYAPYKRVKKKNENKKQWSPIITIPEPFTMTRREERKAKTKSKRIEQIEEELFLKKVAEEAELLKRVTPVPIPPSTFLPLYDELQKEQGKKREYIKNLSKEILKASEKPFSFTKREEAKQKIKVAKSVLQSKIKKPVTKFQAIPFPEELFDLTLADRMAEEEEYRKIKIKLRAEEMLASSSLPMNMKTRNSLKHPVREKTKRVKEELEKRITFKPDIHPNVPNFEVLQRKFENELEEKKKAAASTVCEPFKLKTADIAARRSKFRESIEIKDVPERPLTSRCKTPNSNKSLFRSISNSNINTMGRTSATESPFYRLTETARLRSDHLHKAKEEALGQTVTDKKKQKEHQRLRKLVARKAKVHDPSRNRDVEFKNKMQSFKAADDYRNKEYKRYLKQVDTQLLERPLLFERVSQTNAKLKAQHRYEQILKDAGLHDTTLYNSNMTDAYVRGENSEDDKSYESEDVLSNDGSYVAEESTGDDVASHASAEEKSLYEDERLSFVSPED